MTTSDDAKVIAEATKWLAEYDAIPTQEAYEHFRTHYPLAVYNGALYTRTLLRLLQSRASTREAAYTPDCVSPSCPHYQSSPAPATAAGLK